ncbi:MAG: fibronectin type III domain-containing protein [Akkermansiaceae bacterium]|nr:fibronectin type III domain-containing protein [Akkermansiaceae bacterium]MCP5542715.1 fibronectin type III domain-containing protein [Akkermansiaceae bacterium]MCP5548674.1 fibronectin type III domain-containing protein [Akkermansiaceae bacterium]
MNTQKAKVSYDFGLSDAKVTESTQAVLVNLYGNPAYATPVVTQVDLEAKLQAMQDAIGLQAQGGTAATAAKNARKAELLEMLDKLALYVQGASGGDLEVLLSSGFRAASQNRASVPLTKPVVKRLRYGMTGESRLALVPVTNARCYECRVAEVMDDGVPGPWVIQGPFNSSQKIDVTGLTPGRVYIFQIRAFGGSTGSSDWSDPVSHRSL